MQRRSGQGPREGSPGEHHRANGGGGGGGGGGCYSIFGVLLHHQVVIIQAWTAALALKNTIEIPDVTSRARRRASAAAARPASPEACGAAWLLSTED